MESQRGNIIVYLLIGLVMFGALLSGLWWIKTRAGGEKPTVVAEESQSAQNDKKTPAETSVEQDAVPATDEPTPTPAPAATPAPANNPPAQRPAPSAPQTQPVLPPESQTNRTPKPNEVASSGPVENGLITASGLGVLAYLSTSYVRSRRTH